MKLKINENSNMVFEEVFSPICFKTSDKETIGVCMRDSGFHISYLVGDEYVHIELVNGEVVVGEKKKIQKVSDNSIQPKPLNLPEQH